MFWKRRKIKNKEARIYYISGDGDDANDGLHPLRAWKTINRLNQESGNIRPTDQIFFKRGFTYPGLPFYQLSRREYKVKIYGSGEIPVFPDCKQKTL